MVARVNKRDDGWYVRINYKQFQKAKKCESQEEAEELAEKVNYFLEIQGEKAFETLGLVGLKNTSVPTVEKFGEKWIEDMRSTDLSKTTVDRYEGILRVHIVPEFGSRGLDEVKYRDLRAFVMAKSKSMVMSRRKDQESNKARRKLSRDSLRLIVTTLRRLFAEAVELEYLEDSPVKKSLNRYYRSSKKIRSSTDPFLPEELEKVLQAYSETYPGDYPLVLTLASTGMRFGEAAALKWKDLDFEKAKIHVKRNLPSHGELKRPKTLASKRTVDMSRDLKVALKGLEKERRAEFLKEGQNEIPDWVFLHSGQMVDQSNFHKRWKRTIRKAKVRYRNPHQLRHTFASTLLSKGAPLLYVSKQLGHATPQVTLTYYSKWIPSEDSVSWVDRLRGDLESGKEQEK